MILRLLVLALISSSAFASDVLFIDLNNSKHEVDACKKGVSDASGGKESVEVAGKNLLGAYKNLNFDVLDRYLSQMDAEGKCFDTITISGHDGSGHFFGQNSTSLLSSDVRKLVERHSSMNCLTNMALWGCYTANAQACENFWMSRISPNIRSTIGFTLQSPSNARPGNWSMLQDYCAKRKQFAQAQDSAQASALIKGLDGGHAIKNWNVGICYRGGVCSYDYARVGEKDGDCFHTYNELHQRCKEFDPTREKHDMFQAYLDAQAKSYENPPPDGMDEYHTVEKSKRKPGRELRAYYDQLNLWRHCAEDMGSDGGNFEMPNPNQVILLVKFQTVKTNFARIEKPEIDQYDQLLNALGYNQFTLDRLKDMDRSEIVASTQGAVVALETELQNGTRDRNGVDLQKALVMAKGFDLSLRTLDWRCESMSWVHDGATGKNICVAPYGETPLWHSRK